MGLRDSTMIRGTPEEIFTWLEAMPQAYRGWHADHAARRSEPEEDHRVGLGARLIHDRVSAVLAVSVVSYRHDNGAGS
jgi:hypothetical protein